MKIKATQVITIEFTAESEELATQFFDFIDEKYGIDFELEEQKDNWWVITGMEEAEGWYEPAVLYTKNGDGSPEEYEVDFECFEEYLKDECKEFANKIDDENKFCIERVNCEVIDNDY